ncbi:hypothetical protein Tco_0666858 [Tanacetum coccineum]
MDQSVYVSSMPAQPQMPYYYQFPWLVSSMSVQQQIPNYHVGPSLSPIQFTTQVPASPVQPTPEAFHTMTLQNPNWNINTGASSHLANNTVCQFTRDNDVSVEFDAYGFSVKDYQTGRLLLRCDSTGDLYPVTQQPLSQTTVILLSFSSTTWHRHMGHPRDDVLRRKHAKLPFYNSESSVNSVFEIIHSDV